MSWWCFCPLICLICLIYSDYGDFMVICSVSMVTQWDLMWSNRIYVLMSSNWAGWKIPELNRCFNRKISDKWYNFPCYVWLPEGNILFCLSTLWSINIIMGNGHTNSRIFHWTWYISIVMLNYQRVMHTGFTMQSVMQFNVCWCFDVPRFKEHIWSESRFSSPGSLKFWMLSTQIARPWEGILIVAQPLKLLCIPIQCLSLLELYCICIIIHIYIYTYIYVYIYMCVCVIIYI